MRAGRRVLVAAGVALVVAAAVVTPAVVHEVTRPVPPAKPPKITVTQLGPRAANGVIAAGTVNGKRWQVRLTKKKNRTCWSRRHRGWAPNSDCVEPVGYSLKHWYGYAAPGWIWTFWPAIFGPVKPDVARVTMRLSDGVVLNLRPVEAYGRHWIGIVLPRRLAPVKVVAYSRDAEIAHSVPFVGGNFGGSPDIEFLSWLPPGDDGPRRMTKVVRGGGLTFVLHAGPWGNVLVSESQRWSFPLGDHLSGALEGGGGLPRTVPMAFPWPAAYMKLVMSDGSTRRVPLVPVAGLGFAVIRAASKPSILRWGVFDRRGRRLSGGVGPPGGI